MRSAYMEVLYQYVTPVFAAFSIILNLVEIFILFQNSKTKKTLGTIYILNLAISDVIVGTSMIGLKILSPFMRTDLKGNAIAEEFYNIMRYCFIRLSLFVSVFNLIALTIDRVWAICRPFTHRSKTTGFAIKVCMGVWLLSIVCVTFNYSISRFYANNIERYNNLVFPVATYIATLSFICCYSLIYKTLRNSSELRKSNANNAESITEKHEIAFLKLAVKTITIFVIFWLPFSTCSFVKAVGYQCGGKDVEFSLFTLAFANSVVNPFVYFVHAKKVLVSQFKKLFNWSKLERNVSKKGVTLETGTNSE